MGGGVWQRPVRLHRGRQERESEDALTAGIDSSPLMMEVLLVAACCGHGSLSTVKKECKRRDGGRCADGRDRVLSFDHAMLVMGILLVAFGCGRVSSLMWWWRSTIRQDSAQWQVQAT
jgi:hypothetical protein